MNFANEVLSTSGAIIAFLVITALLKKQPGQRLKLFLFLGMTIPIVVTTLYLAAATIAKNEASVTKGPVHWHADYEIYVCEKVKGKTVAHAGERVDLVDPEGLSNRVGSSDFHEHGDNRIHVEGVVRRLSDVSLGKFFQTVGGRLTASSLLLPTPNGQILVQNGMLCSDGKPGTLQAFVYKTQGKIIRQEKLADFVNYVISPHGNLPPGDCLIFEFTSENKAKTDKICQFHDIAIKKGEYKYEN